MLDRVVAHPLGLGVVLLRRQDLGYSYRFLRGDVQAFSFWITLHCLILAKLMYHINHNERYLATAHYLTITSYLRAECANKKQNDHYDSPHVVVPGLRVSTASVDCATATASVHGHAGVSVSVSVSVCTRLGVSSSSLVVSFDRWRN